jgi:adenine-specific DNA-methyltransferase
MAVSAALLRQGGEFVFITPRSFASGPYFQRFREWFFKRIRPTNIHVFGSRKDAFSRDEVLQENVIFHGVRENDCGAKNAGKLIFVTTSHGLTDLRNAKASQKPWREMVAGREHVLRIPSSSEEDDALQEVEAWNGSLDRYGLKISTGPVVAFRATNWLRQEKETSGTVPLLWLNHVFPLELHWPNGVRKPQYISEEAASEKLLLPNRNYVLMRRFSAKEDVRRLTAAPVLGEDAPWKMVGFENHLNYVYRPNGSLTVDEAWGFAALYSSKLLDSYFRCVNGNTQVSATELRSMPLPSLEAIRELGRKVRRVISPLAKVDDLLAQVLAR